MQVARSLKNKRDRRKRPIRYAGISFSEEVPNAEIQLEVFQCEYFQGKSQLLAFKAMPVSYELAAKWMTPQINEDIEAPKPDAETPKPALEFLCAPKTLTQGDFSAFDCLNLKKVGCAVSEDVNNYLSLIAGGTLTAAKRAPQSLPQATMKLIAAAHRTIDYAATHTPRRPHTRWSNDHPGAQGYTLN